MLATGKEKDGLYLLEHKVKEKHQAQPIRGLIYIKKNKVDILLWHKRMGHASVRAM